MESPKKLHRSANAPWDKRTPLDGAGGRGIRQSVPRRKRRSKSLTYRERMLIECLAQGMSVTRAALKAGYSDQNPGQSGYQALKAVREKAPELLDRHGLTDDVLIEKHLKPMLNATRTALVKHKGKITHEREVIAWGPRIASLKLVFRIRGMYKSEQERKRPNIKTVVMSAENRLPVPPRV